MTWHNLGKLHPQVSHILSFCRHPSFWTVLYASYFYPSVIVIIHLQLEGMGFQLTVKPELYRSACASMHQVILDLLSKGEDSLWRSTNRQSWLCLHYLPCGRWWIPFCLLLVVLEILRRCVFFHLQGLLDDETTMSHEQQITCPKYFGTVNLLSSVDSGCASV